MKALESCAGLASVLATLFVASMAEAAQSPECARASTARAAHAKDYPALQKLCEASKGKRTPPNRPVMQPKSATPQPRPAGQPPKRRPNPFFQVDRTPAPRPVSGPVPRRPGPRPIYVAPAPAPAAAPAPAPAPAPMAPAPVAIVPVVQNPSTVPSTPPPSRAETERVFGLRLGDTLRIPVCREDAARDAALVQSLKSKDAPPQRSNTTCRLAPEALSGNSRLFAQRLANVTVDPLPAGVDFALVSVAAQRCPDWANAAGSCVAGVTTKDDQIVGVSYLAGDDSLQDGIEKSLSEKYGTSPQVKAGTPCQDPKLGSRPGNNRVWDKDGTRVSYFPTGGLTCRQGRVLVETAAMRDLFPSPARNGQASR